MIDNEFLKLFEIYLRIGCFFGGTPFYWDNKKRKVSTTRLSILRNNFFCFLMIFFIFWLLYPTYVAYNEKNTKVMGYAVCCLLAGLIDGGVILMMFRWRNRFENFFPTLFQFTLHYQGNLLTLHEDRTHLNLMYISIQITSCCPLVHINGPSSTT
jgi:hypothetical protein